MSNPGPLIVATTSDPRTAANPDLLRRKQQLYLEAIAVAGGHGALLDTSTPVDERRRLLESMAGLVFTGGADIDPGLYGEVPAGAVDCDSERDRLESEAWQTAERRSVPVLGICRGMQAINVFSGGKLRQHVDGHEGPGWGEGPPKTHGLEIAPRSRLGRAIASAAPNGVAGGDPEDDSLDLEVNSYHHQGVGQEDLAPGLKAVAWSDNRPVRLVEALEAPGSRWVVGVQCHPERLESTPPEFNGLWTSFVEAAAQFATFAERAPAP
jgi:putative glutamine amidotransferase